MKRIIDIDEDYYENLKYNVEQGQKYKPWEIIVNSTPYEERPQGEWVEENSETGALSIKYTWFRCNQCDWSNSLVIPRNFCPNCGAKMKDGAK